MYTKKPILVSDMGGVLYSFSPKSDPNEHEALFEKAIKDLKLEDSSLKKQLEGEFLSIKKGILRIYPNETGVTNLKKNSQKYSIVIVSTSLVTTSKFILEKIGLASKISEIFDMSEYGSKKDPASWKKIFQKLTSVEVIVEDGKENLNAAYSAAAELGYSSKVFSQMPVLLTDSDSYSNS